MCTSAGFWPAEVSQKAGELVCPGSAGCCLHSASGEPRHRRVTGSAHPQRHGEPAGPGSPSRPPAYQSLALLWVPRSTVLLPLTEAAGRSSPGTVSRSTCRRMALMRRVSTSSLKANNEWSLSYSFRFKKRNGFGPSGDKRTRADDFKAETWALHPAQLRQRRAPGRLTHWRLSGGT